MTLKELRERKNKLMTDASVIMSAETITSEQRSKFDTMLADVATIDADITRLEAVERHEAEQRSIQNRPARPVPGESAAAAENVEERKRQITASFRSFMRTGQVESRDLTVGATGAVMIPQQFDSAIISAQKSYGELYNIVDVQKTDNGDPIKVMLDDDTSNGLTSVTVGKDADETDPTTTSKLLQVDTFTTGVVKVDMGLLSDAGFDIEAWLRDKFGKRYFRGSSSLIYNGDSGTVASLAAAYTEGFTSSATAKIGYSDFTSAIAALDPAYQTNAIWAMNNAVLASVLGLTDANSRPLFLPGLGDATQGFVGTILGKPVKLVTQMPSLATGNVPLLFGDFKAAYRFRQQNPGLQIIRLNERYAASYEVGFVGFCRVGGISTQASTTTPPVVACTCK